jgi:hypothetical protein
MANQPVALILGSGPNVGQHVARALVSKGYKVALASRSAPKDSSTSNPTTFQTDLSNPSSVPELFTRVKETLGTPNVVVYNGNSHPQVRPTKSSNIHSSLHCDPQRPQTHLLPPPSRLRKRPQCQYHQRIRRSAASCSWLRAAPRLSLQNVYIHRQCYE